MTDHLPGPLLATLDIVVSAAAGLRDPWWVFGGTAMALAGLEDLHIPDVDILASPRDARALIEGLHGHLSEDPGEGRFRSQVFGQILTTPVPVDVMANMDVRDGGDWTPVTFQTRIPVNVDGTTVFIPAVSEQIDTCRLFGRPKDLERAARLETLIH
tara:strand:- start:64 stop:534 length:471 start_codon:yes stop_codon:yes gene_type:complete